MSDVQTELDPRFSDPAAVATSWEASVALLEAAQLAWITTVRADGRPHVTPLVTVWLDDAVHFCTGAEEQKGVNLQGNAHVVITTGCNTWDRGMDVVVEGDAVRVTDEATLHRLAAAWRRSGTVNGATTSPSAASPRTGTRPRCSRCGRRRCWPSGSSRSATRGIGSESAYASQVHSVLLVLAAFLACAVEMVEALTIVLAVGVTRGLAIGRRGASARHSAVWRSSSPRSAPRWRICRSIRCGWSSARSCWCSDCSGCARRSSARAV